MKPSLIAWAILDKYSYERKLRYCYSGKKGSKAYKNKQVAIYFVRPKLNKNSPFYKKKEVKKVRVEVL